MFGQILLFAASVTVCAARLHGHNLNPAAVTQELNRCLSAVRVAASRRGSSAPQARGITSDPRVNMLRRVVSSEV